MSGLRTKSLPLLSALTTAIVVTACANENRDRENYGTLTTASITSQAQHPHGWQRRECFSCHNIGNIHRGPNAISFAASIADQYYAGGDKICLNCHGPNGLQ